MSKAIGMVEYKTTAAGVTAADLMVKTSEVDIIEAQTVCPGKFIAIIAGDLSAVKAAVDAATKQLPLQLIDTFVLGNPHESIFPAIVGTSNVEDVKALGIMETYSLCAAVHAADAAAKAAEVDLLEVRLGRGLGGKSFILLNGEVAAVQSSIKAAEALEETQGLMAQSAVIPSPHPDMLKAIG